MKIAVYGATGRVGELVVAEAVRRGHEVTALSRHEAEVPAGGAWQHGDLTDEASVQAIAKAHDVVVTANGPSRVEGEDPFEFATLIAMRWALPSLVAPVTCTSMNLDAPSPSRTT